MSSRRLSAPQSIGGHRVSYAGRELWVLIYINPRGTTNHFWLKKTGNLHPIVVAWQHRMAITLLAKFRLRFLHLPGN